jgi:DNA-binding CsgD family transcriptional regulator
MLPHLRSNPVERQALAPRHERTYPDVVTGGRTSALATHAGPGVKPLRVCVAIADDLFRMGLSRMLADEGLEVVAEPPPVAEVVLVDASGAGFAGGRAVALCGPDDDAVRALSGGASAVVARDSSPEVIAAAIRAALGGSVVMPEAVAARLLAGVPEARAVSPGDRRLVETLSGREHEVLLLLAAGLANDEIARELVVTASTVKNHVARIMVKLGARNRTHAAVIATRLSAGARAAG